MALPKSQESTAGSWWLCKPENFYAEAKKQNDERFSKDHGESYRTWGMESLPGNPWTKRKNQRKPVEDGE